MVNEVLKFETEDGQLFDNPLNAEAWESKIRQAKIIKGMFPDSDKLGSGEYYQLSTLMISKARRMFADVLRGHRLSDNDINEFVNGARGSILGRNLCDSSSPFYSIWSLFERIDDNGRMFNQPYYVANPPEDAKYIHI